MTGVPDYFVQCDFKRIHDEEWEQAIRLALFIRNFMGLHKPKAIRVTDLGCGPGTYVQALRRNGIVATGVDISPELPTDGPYLRYDLGVEYDDPIPWPAADIALCLEVGEHMPDDLADTLVENICRTAPLIIFSAALPGQGGEGHINCQRRDYWLTKFLMWSGMQYADDLTDRLIRYMQHGYHMGWFVNNVQCFQQQG